jgi:sugar/nucleoside kinase (ribokinase family)
VDITNRYKVLHNMKTARQKGVETIINPAPAITLPSEAYEGLGHLIVNETEAAILSGIENSTSWDEVAAVFISRGVQNVIITLGGEVRDSIKHHSDDSLIPVHRVSSTRLPNNKPSRRTAA